MGSGDPGLSEEDACQGVEEAMQPSVGQSSDEIRFGFGLFLKREIVF